MLQPCGVPPPKDDDEEVSLLFLIWVSARAFSVLHLFSSFIDMCSLKWPQGGEDEDEMGDVAAETPTVAVKAKEEEVDVQQ